MFNSIFSLKKKYALIACYALIYCIVLVFIVGFNYPRWTDEEHFYFTILNFIEFPNLHTLKHYEEMSTPLPFIIYAIWGKLFNSDLVTLRILSLFISFITILSTFHLFNISKLSFASSVICILILTLNPYFIGVSFFVYTDLICELCMIWVFIFTLQRKVFEACVFLLLAILCRQYMLFFLPVLAIYLFAQENFNITKALIKKELILVLPLFIIGMLFIFWGGTSPDNALKGLYMHQAFTFHGSAVTAYMATAMVYTFPLVFFSFKNTSLKHVLIVLPLAALWYYFSPVQGSQIARESILQIDTIGLVHKTTHLLPSWAEQLFWFVMFMLACLFFVIAFQQALKNYKSSTFLICVSWLLFLLLMSFSYLTWEKYLLPMLPLLLIYEGFHLDAYLSKQLNRIRK